MGIRINGSTSGYTELTAPAVANNITLTLPDSTGSAGQALVSDGAGGMSWSAVASLDVVDSATISGTGSPGSTMTVTNPTVVGGDGNYSYSYQLQSSSTVNGTYTAISGQTSSTHVISSAIGHFVRCLITVSDGGSPALTTTVISSSIEVSILRHQAAHSPGRVLRLGWNGANSGSGVGGAVTSTDQQLITINSAAQTNAQVINTFIGSDYNGLGVVLSDGRVFGNNTQHTLDVSSEQTWMYRAGRTIKQVLNMNGWGGQNVTILYDNGSVYHTPSGGNTIYSLHDDNAASTNPCISIHGSNFYSSSTGCAIYSDGGMQALRSYGGRHDWGDNQAGSGGIVYPLPSGVKPVKTCNTGTQEAYNTHRHVAGTIILGDNGRVYSTGPQWYRHAAMEGQGSAGLFLNGQAVLDPDPNMVDIVDIGGSAGNSYSWLAGSSSGPGHATALKANGTLYWCGLGQTGSWAQVTGSTDYLTCPMSAASAGNIPALAKTANTILLYHQGATEATITLNSNVQPAAWSNMSQFGPGNGLNGFTNYGYIILPA